MILRKAGAALADGSWLHNDCEALPGDPAHMSFTCAPDGKGGLPPCAFNVLTTDLKNIPSLTEALCNHPLVNKVTFTGSTAAGKLVARRCAGGLEKMTLELGGNCPFIIFDDANLEQALDTLMLLKWRHAGQACITANRVYVQAGVIKKFMDMLTVATGELKVGHGAKKGTTMGPITTPRGIHEG